MEFFADSRKVSTLPLGGSHSSGTVHPLFTSQPDHPRHRPGSATSERLEIHLHRYQPGGGTGEERHEAGEQAYYIIEGQMRAKVGAKEYLAEPGACVLIPRGVVHSFQNAGQGELVFLFVSCAL